MKIFAFLSSIGGGGGTEITVVDDYAALLALPPTADTFYWCQNSQGTAWLPGSLGGMYYPRGIYYCFTTSPLVIQFIETPYQATQATVDAGTNDDQFVTPKGLNDSSQLASKVSKADYTPAHSILAQQSGTGSPTTVQIGNNEILGRKSGGGSNIEGLSASEVKSILNYSSSEILNALGWFSIQDQVAGAVSSGTSNTISKSIALPFVPTHLKFRAVGNKTNTNNIYTIRAYLSEVDNNITGTAILIGTITSANGFLTYLPFNRHNFDIISGNIIGLNANTSQLTDDVQVTNARLNTPIPTGTPLYLIFTVQCASSSDSARIETVEISNF